MQTFLPYGDFGKVAGSLDNKRLLKQRVETYQILNCYANPKSGWRHHPAVKMWNGHLDWLFKYQESVCAEVIRRGYRDTTMQKFSDVYRQLNVLSTPTPWWLGFEPLHYSHRGRLYEKNPQHYVLFADAADFRKRGFVCCPTCNYLWVTHINQPKTPTNNEESVLSPPPVILMGG